jgi:hypothetical protein
MFNCILAQQKRQSQRRKIYASPAIKHSGPAFATPNAKAAFFAMP